MLSVAKIWKTLLIVFFVCVFVFVWHRLTMPSDNAVIAKIDDDLELISRSIYQFSEQENTLPNNEKGLTLLVDFGVIEILPKDPWGNQYQYKVENSGRKYRVFTLGRDNAIGGIGLDSDRYVSGELSSSKQ